MLRKTFTFFCKKIKTIKILKCSIVDDNLNIRLDLKLTMTNGLTKIENMDLHTAREKYENIIRDPQDESYIHNHKILSANDLLDYFDRVIPMHENRESETKKCIVS